MKPRFFGDLAILALSAGLGGPVAAAMQFDCYTSTPHPWETTINASAHLTATLLIQIREGHNGSYRLEIRDADGATHSGTMAFDDRQGSTFTQSVPFTAPAQAGEYTVYWRSLITDLKDGLVYTGSWQTLPLSVLGPCNSNDLYAVTHYFTPPYQAGSPICGQIEIGNSGGADCELDYVELQAFGLAVTWQDSGDSTNVVIAEGDSQRVGDPFCFTPQTAGQLELRIYARLEGDDGTRYIDGFSLNVGTPCAPQDHVICHNGDLSWADCNGNPTAVIQGCGFTYYGPWSGNLCDGPNIVWTRSATYRGCENLACFERYTNENLFIATCPYGCQNGTCISQPTVCTPGAAAMQTCTTNGCPGQQTRTCQSDGQWGDFSACAKNDPCCGITCPASYICRTGTCQLCLIHDHRVCNNDDVYWADCFGNPNDLYQDCPDDETRPFPGNICSNGDAYYQSILTDVYCGNGLCQSTSEVRTDLIEDCGARGCDPVTKACFPPEPEPCAYTAIEWQPPLSTVDGATAYFTVNWSGDCAGDTVEASLHEVDLGFDEIYSPVNLLIDPSGTKPQGGAAIFDFTAFYAGDAFSDPEYRLFLEPSGRNLERIASSTTLRVEPFTTTVELTDELETARDEDQCTESDAISDACLDYWEEMGWQFDWERFESDAFDFMNAVFILSCAGCIGAPLAIAGSYFLCLGTGLGCLVAVPLSSVAIDVTMLACPICTGTVAAESSAAVANAVIIGRIERRAAQLQAQNIAASISPLISRRAGALTYIDGPATVTEIYGLGSRGRPYLTYLSRTENFPGVQAGAPKLIKLHRELAEVRLETYYQDLLAMSRTEASAQVRALLDLVNDGRFPTEAEWSWQLFTNNRLGPMRDFVQFRFLPELPNGRFGQYNPVTKELAFAVIPGDAVLAGGLTIPRSTAIRGVVLYHEMGHAGIMNLIKQTKIWGDARRTYELAPDNEYVWAREFMNDAIVRDALQNDLPRYREYVDGFYAIIHDPRRTNPWIDDVVMAFRIAEDVSGEISAEQRTRYRYYGEYLLKMTELSDLPLSTELEARLIQQFGRDRLAVWQTEMATLEADALLLHHELVYTSQTQASIELHRLLYNYRFVAIDNLPPPGRRLPLPVGSNPVTITIE